VAGGAVARTWKLRAPPPTLIDHVWRLPRREQPSLPLPRQPKTRFE